MTVVNRFIKNFGWPRIIIGLFLLVLFIIGPFFGVKTVSSINNVLVRFGMNGVLVLSMVPMIQSGCGLNFGIPVGIIAGLIGAVTSLELHATGWYGIFIAIAIAVVCAAIFGFLYGILLNKVKGDEMIIATYVGYSFVFFMNIMWLVLPYRNPSSVQGFKGEGLRVTISVGDYWIHKISDFLSFEITKGLEIKTGMFLFFGIMCLLVWGFFKTKIGTAVTAVGSNPEYARAAGINVNKMRTISVVISTVVASIGIIIYQQSFGFIQMFNASLFFTFPSVAAILLGGASINKATITNVIIGTLLFQGILTMTPTVMSGITSSLSEVSNDTTEIIRLILSNGLIVYALTRKAR